VGVFGEVGDGGGYVVIAWPWIVRRLTVVSLLVANSNSRMVYLKPGEACPSAGEL
jgi:hypothetical protein